MKEKLAKIKSMAEEALGSAKTLDTLEELRVKFLGKKGELTAVMKGMGALSPEERPKIGQLLSVPLLMNKKKSFLLLLRNRG